MFEYFQGKYQKSFSQTYQANTFTDFLVEVIETFLVNLTKSFLGCVCGIIPGPESIYYSFMSYFYKICTHLFGRFSKMFCVNLLECMSELKKKFLVDSQKNFIAKFNSFSKGFILEPLLRDKKAYHLQCFYKFSNNSFRKFH